MKSKQVTLYFRKYDKCYRISNLKLGLIFCSIIGSFFILGLLFSFIVIFSHSK